MSDLPQCLQPVLEQIQKYETQISALEAKSEALDEHVQDLFVKNENLVQKAKEESESHILQVKTLEEEKVSLRELNRVVNDQLQNKSSLVQTLEEENVKVNSQSQEVNDKQEALGAKTTHLNEELEKIKAENSALKDENSALNLVNSAMHQRYEDLGNAPTQENPLLLSEIENLKNELETYKSENTDTAFLQSENQRLTQRHGEITQEKMQASSKMHAAQNALSTLQNQLDDANKIIQQSNFDLQGLHKLHSNLNDEKNARIQDTKDLEFEKRALDEKLVHQEENIQQLVTEKALVSQELASERKKADTLTQVINELRLKNEKLKAGIINKIEPKTSAKEEPEVEALEISNTEDEMIKISKSTPKGPTFPGEH